MWKLVRLSLAYHCRTLLVAWGVAFGLGLVLLLFNWFGTSSQEYDHSDWLKLPLNGLVATVIAGLVAFEIEDKERRLVLHLPLPVTRIQVGLARVVFPAVIIILGTAAMALLASAILIADGGGPTAGAAKQLLFSTNLELFFLQLLLAFLTFVRGGRERLRALLGMVTLVLLLGLIFFAWVELAKSGSYLAVGIGTAAMTLGLMGLSAHLLEQRQSFTGG